MRFARSQQSTLGIEWELQLIDEDSNDLRQAAAPILAELDGSPYIHGEMLRNTVEVVSGVHTHVNQCVADLNAGIDQLKEKTAPLRIELASAGSHPFANPAYQRVTDKERYATLVNRTQYWGRQMLLFGTHVHVGIDRRAKVLPLLKAVLTRAYHIQALSSSSPFWAGEDTHYASNRAMVFQQLPTAGTPRQFDTWEELEHFTSDMITTGTISDISEMRWDVRPSPGWGTLELRVADANTNTEELAAIAALIHCLVDYYSDRYDAGMNLPTMPDWFVAENKWRAARYGMDAILIVDDHGTEEPVAETLRGLITTLEPYAERLGCTDELRNIERICHDGAAYQRFREVARLNGGSRDAVVEHMRAEMRAERPVRPTFFGQDAAGPR